ncbi:MAG: hypothetical protein Kow0079_01160 [Vicingaceae bacterium]
MNKLFTFLLYTITTAFILSSLFACKTRSEVVNNGWLQKRKYSKGYYLSSFEQISNQRISTKIKKQPNKESSKPILNLNNPIVLIETVSVNMSYENILANNSTQDLQQMKSKSIISEPKYIIYNENLELKNYKPKIKLEENLNNNENVLAIISAIISFLISIFSYLIVEYPIIFIAVNLVGILCGYYAIKKNKLKFLAVIVIIISSMSILAVLYHLSTL